MDPLDPCAPPDLRHLRRLTNGFGVWQHTKGDVPHAEMGYSIDDVARALIVVSECQRLFPAASPTTDNRQPTTLADLAEIYLKFIEYCQLPDGRFHNFVSADRAFHDDAGSPDSYGRTMWALGTVVRNSQFPIPDPPGVAWAKSGSQFGERAAALLDQALPHVRTSPDLRSKAFTLLGLLTAAGNAELKTHNAELLSAAERLVTDLLRAYDHAASPDWPWFEDMLRYSNGALPYALLAAASNTQLRTQNAERADRARAVGLRSLDFLLAKLPVEGVPAPVGNQWWPKGGTRSLYDQQCVDAAAMVLAAAEAFTVTHEVRYRDAAQTWWHWFFGNNTQKKSLYRPEDGAVYDGLTPGGVNENRGAESIVAFLLAHLKLAETICPRSVQG